MDFASIRGLFGGSEADPKTVAVIAGPGLNHRINHLSFRRTFETTQRVSFEIDHYDYVAVPLSEAVENPFAWRVGLLGGGRLRILARRFRELRSLQAFIAERGWEYGEGFIAANSGRRATADFLTGMRLLPTTAFTADGIDESQLSEVQNTLFRSAYSRLRYTAPLLLVKKHQRLFHAVWNDGNLAYKAQIIGVHPTDGDHSEFQRLVSYFEKQKRLLQFSVALNGSRGLGIKATAIEKQDIDLLPYPESESDLVLAFWEQILLDDTLDEILDYVRLGNDSRLLQQMARSEELNAYSNLYCRMLSSIYDNLHAAETVFLDGLICQPFYFGDEPSIEWLGPDCGEQLQSLVYDTAIESLRTIRVVRIYHENVIFIVKPDRLRYWIRSTAIRDADDTLVELQQQGY